MNLQNQNPELPTNISYYTKFHPNKPNTLHISYSYKGEVWEVEVVLDNDMGAGGVIWLYMLNSTLRDIYTTSDMVLDSLKKGDIREEVIKKWLVGAIKTKDLNHYPKLPTPPLPTTSSLTISEYEEELEQGLTPEEMVWYYERDMERIMGEMDEDGLSDMERANL